MKEEFENYLLDFGYKETTPSGGKSTVPQYVDSIDKIVQWEHLGSWEQLVPKLPILLREYETGGIKEHLGARSKRTVINALKRFADFIDLQIEIYDREF